MNCFELLPFIYLMTEHVTTSKRVYDADILLNNNSKILIKTESKLNKWAEVSGAHLRDKLSLWAEVYA